MVSENGRGPFSVCKNSQFCDLCLMKLALGATSWCCCFASLYAGTPLIFFAENGGGELASMTPGEKSRGCGFHLFRRYDGSSVCGFRLQS